MDFASSARAGLAAEKRQDMMERHCCDVICGATTHCKVIE